MKLEDRSREERLEITRHELKKQLKQIIKSRVGKARNNNHMTTTTTTNNLPSRPVHLSASYDRLVAPCMCEIKNCEQPALPCTKFCTLHIMHNTEQVLFDYCTAKFADNTQCSVPVFDITHELPLCPEHARKRVRACIDFISKKSDFFNVFLLLQDNYKMFQEAKPKKLRKKVKPSAMIRPQKRSKKKKRPSLKVVEGSGCAVEIPITAGKTIFLCYLTGNFYLNNKCLFLVVEEEPEELAEDMVEQVLNMQEEPDSLELVAVEQALVTQASHLLEESDINTVLSTIQADEFNDLFTGDFFTHCPLKFLV